MPRGWLALTCAFAAVASVVSAQTQPPAAPPGPAWELSGYGGVVSTARTSGVAVPPPAGAPILTSSPVFPSREVSSWLVGDGAVLLNDVLEAFSLTPRLTPLDRALDAMGGDRATNAAFGIRLVRRIKPRLAAEVSFDVLPGTTPTSDGFVEAVEMSRSTFESSFAGLLTTGPFSAVSVTAVRDTADGSSAAFALTGALHFQFGTARSFAPYLAAGGGVITGTGTATVSTVTGQYRFTLPSGAGIMETDVAALHVGDRARCRSWCWAPACAGRSAVAGDCRSTGASSSGRRQHA